ncbi:hypothetical protein Q9189_008218 [Teloschistes chrysophthalmus]
MVQSTRSGTAALRSTPIIWETQQPTAPGPSDKGKQREQGRATTIEEEDDSGDQLLQDRQLEEPLGGNVPPDSQPQTMSGTLPGVLVTNPNASASSSGAPINHKPVANDDDRESSSEPEDDEERVLVQLRAQLLALNAKGIGMDRILGKKTKGQKKAEQKKKKQAQALAAKDALATLAQQGILPSVEDGEVVSGDVAAGGAGGGGGDDGGSSDDGAGNRRSGSPPHVPHGHGHGHSRSRTTSFVDVVSPGMVSAAQRAEWMADPDTREMGKMRKPAPLDKYPPKGGLQGHRDWVNRAERIFRTSWYYFPNELSKIDYGALALEGNHATRWNDKEADGKTRDWSFYRFQEFLLSINMDSESRSLVAASDYLKAYQQNDQTVTQFHSFLNALENQLPKLPEEWRKIMFVLRLREELQAGCRIANAKLSDLTLEQWVEIATRHETLLRGKASASALNLGHTGKSNQNSGSGGKRKRDNQPGGGARNNGPPSRPSGGGGGNSGGHSGGNSGRRSGGNGKPIWCFKCGQNDHIAPNCHSAADPDLVQKRKDNEARTGAVHAESSSKNDRPAAKRPRQTGQ